MAWSLNLFLAAERIMRAGREYYRVAIDVVAHREVEVTRLEAEGGLRRLDEALNPWGDPGVVPTDPGDYWLAGALSDAVSAVTMQMWTKGPEWFGEANVGSHDHLVSMAQEFGYQFRRRWTPSPPK